METLVKQEYLKDKFSGIERQIKDNGIPFELSTKKNTESLHENQKLVNLKQSNGLIKLVYRVIKATLKFCILVSKSIWGMGLLPFGKYLSKSSLTFWENFHSKKEKMEITLNKIVTQAEDEILVQEVAFKIKELDKIKNLSIYETELTTLFSSINCKTALKYIGPSLAYDNPSLEYTTSLFEMLVNQLKETKLCNNLNKVYIKTEINEVRITNTVEFDLKMLGLKWSLIFGKTIITKIFKSIEQYKGQVDSHLMSNVSLQSEKLIFVFCHQRIDSLVQKPLVENVGMSKLPNHRPENKITI